LKQNQLNLKKILDLLEDFIMLISSTGEVQYSTRLPRQAEDMPRGKTFKIHDILSKSAANQILENVKIVLEQQEIKTFNIQTSANGQLKTFNAKIAPYEDTEVLLWLNDISKQRENEDYLRKSEARFRILFDSAAQAIILSDMHGRISLVNTQVEKIFGYSRDELSGQPIEILIPSFYRDKHVRHRSDYILNPLTKKMAEERNVNALCKNGNEIPVEISLSPVEMHDGLYILAFILDISEKRKLENRIRQIEKLEAVGQLAGGIAHDFNNVLAGIMGLTELSLRKIDKDSPAAGNLKLVLEKAENAAGLVSQLMAFSKQRSLSPGKLNLNSLIEGSHKMLQQYIGEDINLIIETASDLNHIFADRSAMDQIITNLCINARDAMPDGGDLIIKTENCDLINENISISKLDGLREAVKLSVKDNGIGMRREVQKHIFEPFYTTKEFGEGTGLGLATVYGLVQQHNGFLQFSSIPGEGTLFEIFFPVQDSEDSYAETDDEAQEIPGGTETILIADDEPYILKSAKEILEDYNYKVFICANGQDALEIFKKNSKKISLIISDIVMPKMGGVELKLQAERIRPGVKFIFMSGYSEKVSPELIALQKPFSSNKLLRMVRSILDEV